MSKGIKYTSTHFNTPPKNIIKQTKENQNYAITKISNEKNENSKKKEQHMKKHANIYDKQNENQNEKNDKITKSLISRVRLAEIIIILFLEWYLGMISISFYIYILMYIYTSIITGCLFQLVIFPHQDPETFP